MTKHNYTRYKKYLINTAKNDQDFDYTSIYKLERAKLIKVKSSLKQVNIFEGINYQIWVLGICIKLLDVLICEHRLNKDTYEDINYKNINRFVPNNLLPFYTKFSDYYYVIKATNLYYELRKQYTDYWWI